MDLLNVVKARSVWLFDINDLNPRGKSVFPELIDWLKDNYSFSKVPSSPADFDETKALAFLDGHFQAKEEIFLSVDLRIYNDGLIADTRASTKDTDAFLADVLDSAMREFTLAHGSEINRRTLYVSELTVRSSRSLDGLNPGLLDFCKRISVLLGIENKAPFETFGISFWNDPALPTGLQHFRLERKVGVPFSENRYYSIAPLQSDDHLALLKEFESLLGG
ncbi:MAG TPA: hypothetical protein VGI46_03570 [Candidatus Acidoferrum sp.]|jgi:hypothetical protein